MNNMSFWSLEYLMGRWRPTIGDPSFKGWFIVGSYFACAILSLILVLPNQNADRRFFLFWRIIGLLMILLGINKQLDLQSLFTEIGRQIARAQGWMDKRQIVQLWFIVVFGITATVAFLLFVRLKRDLFRRFRFAFIGLFFLLCFIVIRAAGFHHFDEMLGFRLFGAKMNWLLELTGIYTIVLAAFKEIIILKKGQNSGTPYFFQDKGKVGPG
jgi:hypothetical protein